MNNTIHGLETKRRMRYNNDNTARISKVDLN